MTQLKYALLVTNLALAFYFLATESGLALVCATAALALMCSLWIEE
jgi:hypothetical protein